MHIFNPKMQEPNCPPERLCQFTCSQAEEEEAYLKKTKKQKTRPESLPKLGFPLESLLLAQASGVDYNE